MVVETIVGEEDPVWRRSKSSDMSKRHVTAPVADDIESTYHILKQVPTAQSFNSCMYTERMRELSYSTGKPTHVGRLTLKPLQRGPLATCQWQGSTTIIAVLPCGQRLGRQIHMSSYSIVLYKYNIMITKQSLMPLAIHRSCKTQS